MLLSLTTVGCFREKQNKSVTESIVSVEISEEIINNNLDYSDLIDSIGIIKLETNDQSVIGSIRKILVKNEKFYIYDRMNRTIVIFNKNGKFINKLNRNGKGPGEYFELRDFDVDENDNIHILSYNKILTYNSSLDCTNERELQVIDNKKEPFYNTLFLFDSEYIFLYRGCFGMRKFNNKPALCCIDNKNKIISEYFPVSFQYPYSHQTFYRSDNKTYLSSTMGNDTIFKIMNSTLSPKWIIQFGDKKLTESYIIRNRSDLYNKVTNDNLLGGIRNIFENEKYLCFIFNHGVLPKQAVYNKISGMVKILNYADESLPLPEIVVNGLIGNSFFSYSDSYKFVKGTKYYNKYHKLLEDNNISDVREIDNPLIFKFSFNFN